MTGPVSIFAVAEMHRRAEQELATVRRELLRCGSTPAGIQVIRQGYLLQLSCRQQLVRVDADQLLEILKAMPSGSDEAQVWTAIRSAFQNDGQQGRRDLLLLLIVFGGLALLSTLGLLATR